MIPLSLKQKIVLGTVQLGLQYGINNIVGKPSRVESFKILQTAIDNGIDLLDTADAYGDAIQVIGEFLQTQPTVTFRIISKFISDSKSLDEKLDKTLTTIGTQTLYAYMYHRFADYSSGNFRNALLHLRTQGKIEKIGVSVYGIDELSTVVDDSDVGVIQTPFSPFDNSPDKQHLFKKAKAQGQEIHVRSIFLQGLLFKQPHELTGNLQRLAEPLRDFHSILRQFNLNVNQACLNYALHHPLIDRVLIGVDTSSQLNENLNAIIANFRPEITKKLESIHISDKRLLNPTNWEP